MKKRLWLSRNELDQYKKYLLRKQVKNLANNIPFYRRYFAEQGLSHKDFNELEDIKKLPLITKEQVLSNEDLFFNIHLDKKNLHFNKSSGSTGLRLTSYFDDRTWIKKKYLSKLRSKLHCGLKFSDKLAIINNEHPNVNKALNRKLIYKTPLLRTRYFSSLSSPKEVINDIIRFKPEVIYGPPNFLFLLAEEYHSFKVQALALRIIFTSSEMLSNRVSSFLKNVFKAKVIDIYGSSEFKEIAWQCHNGHGYHINEDEVIVEIMKNKKDSAPEEIGNIVVTDLINQALPLIRYQLSDTGTFLKEPCTCGLTFRLMSPKGGRANDYIILKSGKIFSQFVVMEPIYYIDAIKHFQIIQHKYNQIEVLIIADKKHYGNIQLRLINQYKRLFGEEVEVTISLTDSISTEENGKFKVVKSLVAQPPDSI